MTRTTISLPEDLLKRLRVLAAERRTSMAKLIREAVEKELSGQHPRPRSLGIAESGSRYTSEEASNVRPQPR
ncbi:MAG: CopG family transcriptional regulator [Gammaproteobacteria bacterium]|nr:CopG family transcriptional regulator [Gammaproteobacteria bacterium]